MKKYICIDCDIKFRKKESINNHNRVHAEQNMFFKKYIKKSFDDIEFVNGIPKVFFVCWFGGYKKNMPLMSYKRYESFKSLVKNIEIPVILLTFENYKYFEVKGYPIHKSFDYLTANHKSDYLRAYLLHHYGGGYHDIKFREKSCSNEFDRDDWLLDDNIWMYGRREKNPDCIGYPPGKDYIKKEYNILVTMCWIICKKNTEYTRNLLNSINNVLDSNYQNLINNPGSKSSGYRTLSEQNKNKYPLRWLEIMGEIFHPLMLKYNKHIKYGFPDALKKSYK